MTLAATFLGGAKSRLLPASIPFRFFASATVFHVLMWISLFIDADQAVGFRGGLGPALSSVHLLTIGVLTTTAIGASVQLLPVATRRALVAIWPVKVVFWLTVPGLLLLVVGMHTAEPAIMIPAATLVTLGLLLFAGLLADNLRRANSLPVVAAYGWAALICLVTLVALGLALAADYRLGMLSNHDRFALAHVILGGFGFMGLLALGFSHVLVPMFALSSAPPKGLSWIGFGTAVAGVALGALGAVTDNQSTLIAATLIGLTAAVIHLRLMSGALKVGMRKRLGLSFLLIRAAWILLPATLLVGLASLYGYAGRNGPTLFGILLLGWLLTFLFGILQRIEPFLASMHVSGRTGVPSPLMSELTASAPLKLHAACHALALALVALAILADTAWPMRIGTAIGLAGAVSFAWFTATIVRRLFWAR